MPTIDPMYGGTRPKVVGIVRPCPGQELFQPEPGNPSRGKRLLDHDSREAPETDGYGAGELFLRGGEAPNDMAMVPLRPPCRIIASALSTNQPVNQEQELVAIEDLKGSVVPLPRCDLMLPTQELVNEAEDSPREIFLEWKSTEPTSECLVGSAVTLNSRQTTIPSTTGALYLPGGIIEAAETGPAQAIPTPPALRSRERRILPPPSGSSGLPTPPPSWRLPIYHSPSRIPVPRGGGAYHGHHSLQRRIGLSSIIPPFPTRPSTIPKSQAGAPTPPRTPTPPKTPPLILTQKLHQRSVREDPSGPIQAEDRSLGEMEIHEIEPGPTKSQSLPSFNRPKKFRKRLTEESLRVWILRQCYLAKLNAAYEEGMRKQEGVSGEDLVGREVFVNDGGSFI